MLREMYPNVAMGGVESNKQHSIIRPRCSLPGFYHGQLRPRTRTLVIGPHRSGPRDEGLSIAMNVVQPGRIGDVL